MKRYVKADAEDIWYTDTEGRDQHAFVDFDDPNSVRRVLEQTAGYDFANAFADFLYGYKHDRDLEVADYKDIADDYLTGLSDDNDDIATAVSNLRDIINDLSERLGGADQAVSKLIDRAYSELDDAEDGISGISGTIYDFRTGFELEN